MFWRLLYGWTRYPGYFSTFISRIRRFWQDATVPAGMQPAEAGIPGWHSWSSFSKFIS